MPALAEQIRELVVPASDLRRACPPLKPVTTPDTNYLGQQRAVDAIRFGMQMERHGYNIFVLGPLGSHRHKLATELPRERAAEQGAPDDWCYINNFAAAPGPRSC